MAKSSKPRKPRVAAPEGETKEQKFSRLATARINKAVKAIKMIGNLSGSGYSYTPEQIDKISDVLNGSVKSTMIRFNKEAAKAEETITI